MILEERKHSLALNEKISPQRVYEIGAACIKEKTEKALKLYNRMMPDFCCYGNQCLYDTFVKDISGYTGIDAGQIAAARRRAHFSYFRV